MLRREFIAAGLGAVALGPLSAGERAMQPIVDTHQHLWDRSKVKLGWVTPDSPLNHDYRPQEYAVATEGLGIVKAIYMEVDVVPESRQAEVDYIVELCKGGKTPTVAGVLGGHPADEGFAKYAAQFKGSKYVKGIRQVVHVPDTPAGYCLSKEFIKGVQLLGEMGLSFDICIRPRDLGDAAKLADACPGTHFILDHCGNAQDVEPGQWEGWKKGIAAVAAKKNVVGKVSGIAYHDLKEKWSAETVAPGVKHTIAVFGWGRVMFGGDWPVCTRAATYKEWVEALKGIVAGESAENRAKLFHDNAVKFYGLG